MINKETNVLDIMITDKEILEFFTNEKGKLISKRTNFEYLKKNSRYDIIEFLRNRFNDINESTSISEILYRISNNINEVPKCIICGRPLPFKSGYPHSMLCSRKCQFSEKGIDLWKEKLGKTMIEKYGVDTPFKSKEIREKRKKNWIEKYGVDNPWKAEEVKEKIKNTWLEKYGETSPLKNESVKQKLRNTNKEKYGKDYMVLTEDFKEKSKKTCLKKYGVEHAAQSEEIKAKVKSTCLERYNTEYVMQSEDFKEKSKKTCLKKYGVEHAAQSEEIKKKTRKTCLEKYGKEYITQTKDFKEKSKNTCLEKYGVEYISQSKEVKEKAKKTWIEKYGVDNPWKAEEVKEKIKNTWLEKYGGYPTSNKEIQQKSLETMRKNGTISHFLTSYEKIVKQYLESKFGKEHVIYQYLNKEKYPWKCDFYVDFLDLYIEVQGYWTHGYKPYNEKDNECVELVQKWIKRSNEQDILESKKSKYKNAIYNYTIRDVEKRNKAIENNLNYLELFGNTKEKIENELNEYLKSFNIS